MSHPSTNFNPMTEIDRTNLGFSHAWANDQVEILIDRESRGAKAMLVFPWDASSKDIQVGVARAKEMGFGDILEIGNIEHTFPGREGVADCDYYLMGAAV